MRVPFELVFPKVEALYDDVLIRTDYQVDEQIRFIRDFLQACGWLEEEYQDECLRRTEELDRLSSAPYLDQGAVN